MQLEIVISHWLLLSREEIQPFVMYLLFIVFVIFYILTTKYCLCVLVISLLLSSFLED